jgi:MFS transporter, PPP family, 3-phenylpropionic acid transporter
MRLLWRSWPAVFLYLSANFQPRLTNASDPVAVEHRALLRFMMLYSALFSAFGLASPFLPAFLAGRGLGPEEIGLVLGAATALRLVCGPIAGRLADRFHAFRAELAVCAILAATAALLYLAAHELWSVMTVSLFQAAALAPLVPLADALSLAHARPQQNTPGFEYGWVRGMGSAAFVAGTLLAGQAVDGYGLSAIIWLSAATLMATPIAVSFVPPFPANAASENCNQQMPRHPWLTLLRQRASVRVISVAALVLGSHAMYDSFAVIRWTEAGISPASVGVLWSESVAAEILVFLFLGPRLLRVIAPTVALTVAAFCGVLRWAVIAQTTDIAALALVQPLHGFTFALLHLATMRVIGDTVPRALAATAQTVYGVVAVGGTIAVLTLLSGWLYARFGPAGFWAMGTLCTAAFPVIWLLHQALPTSLARVKTCTPAGHLAGERRGGLC